MKLPPPGSVITYAPVPFSSASVAQMAAAAIRRAAAGVAPAQTFRSRALGHGSKEVAAMAAHPPVGVVGKR